MMQQLRAYTERVNATAPRVAVSGDACAALANPGVSTTGTNGTTGFTNTAFGNTAWNAVPSVHPTAICTHGKPYERRLQEMLT